MFSDFNSYTDGPAGLMKLMSVSEPKFFHAYKERLAFAEEFRSIVVFPEQMIGFSGRLFVVKTNDDHSRAGNRRILTASHVDVTSLMQNRETITEDDQLNLSENCYFITGNSRAENFITENEFKFVKRKHAARFAAKLAGQLFGDF